MQTSNFNKINHIPKPSSSIFFHWWEHRKICIFLADKTGDQASVHFMWALPKGGGFVFYALKQEGVPSCQTQKSSGLDTHIVHTLAQDLHKVHHQPFLSLLTAFMFFAWEDTLSWFFILESILWIQPHYIPDNVSQKVTDNHSLFLTVSPNPLTTKEISTWFLRTSSRQELWLLSTSEMKLIKRLFKCPTVHQSQQSSFKCWPAIVHRHTQRYIFAPAFLWDVQTKHSYF